MRDFDPSRPWEWPSGAWEDEAGRTRMLESGEVVQAIIVKSSGNVAFDRSVEQAVLRASPLPVPRDPSLFVREIQFIFDPEG